MVYSLEFKNNLSTQNLQLTTHNPKLTTENDKCSKNRR